MTSLVRQKCMGQAAFGLLASSGFWPSSKASPAQGHGATKVQHRRCLKPRPPSYDELRHTLGAFEEVGVCLEQARREKVGGELNRNVCF